MQWITIEITNMTLFDGRTLPLPPTKFGDFNVDLLESNENAPLNNSTEPFVSESD